MKLLCFQAQRFRWKTHAKTLPEAADLDIEEEIRHTAVIFIHAEASDADQTHASSVLRQSLKHIKWLANKRELKKIVLHSFSHLGGATAEPAVAESLITNLSQRLSETGYQVWRTPFGYSCEWDLEVFGESLAKVWKEIH